MSKTTEHEKSKKYSAEWITYRKEIKVLDCTIRDGGLMNDSQFDDAVVRGVYKACVEGGVDYMEIGYKGSGKIFSPSEYGAWRFCKEDDMRRIVGDNKTDLKLAVMADAEKCDYKADILPKQKSVIDMIRVATYVHQIPLALDMIKDAHQKGYEVAANLMASSTVQEVELFAAIEMLAKSEARAIYLVDSFGHFYGQQTRYFVEKYLAIAKSAGKEVGIHAHDNLRLAFSNTIEAIVAGANFLDATMAGMGRGAGNCQMELLIGFLHNPKYRLRPILECVEKHIEPMRAGVGWGFDIPYMITGFQNSHPNSAINFNDGKDRGQYTKFFDMAIREEIK